jgi:hypothetical protein
MLSNRYFSSDSNLAPSAVAAFPKPQRLEVGEPVPMSPPVTSTDKAAFEVVVWLHWVKPDSTSTLAD